MAEKKKVKQFSKDMIGRQCWDACHLGEADRGVGMMIVLKMHFPYLIGIVIQKNSAQF